MSVALRHADRAHRTGIEAGARRVAAAFADQAASGRPTRTGTREE